MPRNVRNFWIDLSVDGRSHIASGPRSKEGGFSLVLQANVGGSPERVLTIVGRPLKNGMLRVDIEPTGPAAFEGRQDASFEVDTRTSAERVKEDEHLEKTK